MCMGGGQAARARSYDLERSPNMASADAGDAVLLGCPTREIPLGNPTGSNSSYVILAEGRILRPPPLM